MLTSEGTVKRNTHVVKDGLTEKIRLLTPIECKRLNQSPNNWTNTIPNIYNTIYYFLLLNLSLTLLQCQNYIINNLWSVNADA